MKESDNKWNAEDYAKNSSAQLKWAEELIAKLCLKGNEAVLDIGCGDGKISALLASKVKHGNVTGIDLSGDMIGLAIKEYPQERYPNLSFKQMAAENIRLTGKFDVAFSNAALHWVKDNKAVLRGVRVCLNAGGRILFQMGGRGNAEDIMSVIDKLVHQTRWSGFFHSFEYPYSFCGPGEYKSWLAEYGFRTVRAELIEKDMQHSGTEGLKGWLRTTWFPVTDRLPADQRDGFLDEVIGIYTAGHPLDRSGNTHVRMVRLEVEACIL